MKKILLIICSLLLTINISIKAQTECKDEIEVLRKEILDLKKRVKQLEQQNAPDSPRDIFAPVPCMKESYDTDNEFHGFGIGKGPTAIQAKQNAVKSAVEDLSVEAFLESITIISFSSSNGKKESRIENNITEEQKQFINNNCQVECYNIHQEEDGIYQAYVAISLASTKIKQYKQNME